DLEGRPLAGVTVRATALFIGHDDDLGPTLAALRDPTAGEKHLYASVNLKRLSIEIAATSAADGSFRLSGLGRERIARLRFEGPAVATDEAYVMTRPGRRVVAPASHGVTLHERSPFGGDKIPKSSLIRPARFEHALAPSVPIEGTVRDRDTGKPLGGFYVSHREYIFGRDFLLTTCTGPDGRYRLTGAPLKGRLIEVHENQDYQ